MSFHYNDKLKFRNTKLKEGDLANGHGLYKFYYFCVEEDHEERGNGSENKKKMITWFMDEPNKMSKLQEKKRIVYIIDVVQFFGISSHLTRLTMKIS